VRENLNDVVGRKLREVRTEKGLSLDKLSDLTGVSKAMLGQIERGDSSPTVSTMWKIANGLGVSFTTFFEENEPTFKLVSKHDVRPIPEESGLFQVRPLYRIERGKPFEAFAVTLQPGCHYQSEAHAKGVEELLFVQAGSMTIDVDENKFVLSKDQSIRFSADYAHEYHNPSSMPCELFMIIYYPS
jgi:transcriptional regulator with XRE-family HTH domain